MADRTVTYLDDIGLDETDVVDFDFTKSTALHPITGTPTVTQAVHAGQDPAPNSMLVGGPTVDVTNKHVYQRIKGTLDQVWYCLSCDATINGSPVTVAAIIKSRALC